MIRPLLFLALLPGAAQAASLDLPAPGERVATSQEQMGSLRLPITGWEYGGLQTLWAEGAITHEAWQLQAGMMTTLDILAPLRLQLAAEGFDILFECEARGCGGFDFRYALDVLPEPEMHVDLGDFRYLAASRAGETQPEYVALLVSRAAGRGFVQITRVGPPGPLRTAAVSTRSEPPVPSLTISGDVDLIQTMVTTGGAVLDDLNFAKGSSRLTDGAFASLAALATFLTQNPQAQIVLVGHTDADGTLAGNIALSKSRAAAVRTRLIENHDAPGARIRAEGVGYLAPLTSNLTESGRTRNRRVEVILINPG